MTIPAKDGHNLNEDEIMKTHLAVSALAGWFLVSQIGSLVDEAEVLAKEGGSTKVERVLGGAK